MYNPIRFIKDVIELVRTPPGEALRAMEITPSNWNAILSELGPDAKKYAINGDFVVEFENNTTIVPKKDFHKHYAFVHFPVDSMTLMPVKTIKPL